MENMRYETTARNITLDCDAIFAQCTKRGVRTARLAMDECLKPDPGPKPGRRPAPGRPRPRKKKTIYEAGMKRAFLFLCVLPALCLGNEYVAKQKAFLEAKAKESDVVSLPSGLLYKVAPYILTQPTKINS